MPARSQQNDPSLAIEELRSELEALKLHVWTLSRAMEERDFVLANIGREEEISGMKLLESVALTADQAFDKRDGFFDLEYSKDGIPFRWTGPERTSSFRVWINRKPPTIVEIHITDFGRSENRNSLVLSVDGQSVDYTIQPAGAGWILKSAPVALSGDRVYTLLQLHVPYTYLPNEHGHNDDRRLGVGISQVRVHPA